MVIFFGDYMRLFLACLRFVGGLVPVVVLGWLTLRLYFS